MLPKTGNCLFECLRNYIDFLENAHDIRLYICNMMENICVYDQKDVLYNIIVEEANKYDLTWSKYIKQMRQDLTSGGTLELLILGIEHNRRVIIFFTISVAISLNHHCYCKEKQGWSH